MELNIKTEDLRKKRLFVATPMFGGSNHGIFMKSCLDLQNLLTQYGIQCKFSFIFNESLITRARNYLADEFLNRSNSTHLLFIDSDIGFDPQDVLALLALDKDIIGGPYPKKSIKWANIKKAILKNPTIEDGQLNNLVGDYVFNPVKGTQQFSISEPLQVLEIGTGFMMIKKEVFERFKEAYPKLSYLPDHVGQAHFDGTREIHAFFDCFIDSVENGGVGSNRYLSEDYAFCQRWRFIGGEIHLCPWMKLTHVGTYMFTGDMNSIGKYLGEI
jgi:hypothetical protein